MVMRSSEQVQLKIYAERVGLGKMATSERIVEQCHKLGEENPRLLAKVEKLSEENAALRRELGRTGDPEFDRVIRLNRENRAGGASKAMTAAEERAALVTTMREEHIRTEGTVLPLHEVYARVNKENPELFAKWQAERREDQKKARFATEPPAAPVIGPAARELTSRVAKMMGENPKMGEAEAVQKIYGEDLGLFNRVTAERRGGR